MQDGDSRVPLLSIELVITHFSMTYVPRGFSHTPLALATCPGQNEEITGTGWGNKTAEREEGCVTRVSLEYIPCLVRSYTEAITTRDPILEPVT